jgi:dolichol-phosphate mannosyltransferase
MTDSTMASAHSTQLTAAPLTRLAVVVPCFNEEESIDKLVEELAKLRAEVAQRYVIEILFVDDGSRDRTLEVLRQRFAGDSAVRIIAHERNQGIAGAIQTGIRAAGAEIVGSIDADCTYEPARLAALADLLTDDVAMVVASPYHPAGGVVGVPQWRLLLSRLASRLYRMVMRNKLYTYTSCFRIYRRSAVIDLPLSRGGFVGIVELLWQVDRRGGRIVECPAVLRLRTTGQSKMRTARTALAHLRFLTQAFFTRRLKQASMAARDSISPEHPSFATPAV